MDVDSKPTRVTSEPSRSELPERRERPSPPAPSDEEAGARVWSRVRRLAWVAVVALLVNLLVVSLFARRESAPVVSYSVFSREVERNNVEWISAKGDSIEGSFRTPVAVDRTDEPITEFATVRPVFADDRLSERLIANGVEVRAEKSTDGTNWFLALLVNFGPALLIVGAYFWLMRRSVGALGGITSLGRSRAVRTEGGRMNVTFADVAGIDEAREELVEIVGYLRDPARYHELGARAPRGVLLMGPPGTGKTLLAKAVAGEAQVPFFSMSAAEFIEMIVGVGASRVRDLFDQAKAVAPSIVFIDELDAIGRARGSIASFGGVDEREQTLNQILTEMDGFTANEGVIVLAATNRPDVLDPALLRPGRFDRRIVLNPPDQSGRAAILKVHTRSVPLASDVDLDAIASTTPGMVGADLANLVNEAALTAARHDRHQVHLDDFTDALERILLGAERKIMLTEEDRRRTAFHESGHALLGMLQEGADPVRKISIIPRGRSLGATLQSPSVDRYGMSEAYLRGRIIGALGGRAAEEIVFGDLTTGAESDLEQVTALARQMVGRWGMSAEVGPFTVLPEAGSDVTYLSLDPRAPAEETRLLVDREAKRIIDECHDSALAILRAHREQLDALADELLRKETLDEEDAYRVARITRSRTRTTAGP